MPYQNSSNFKLTKSVAGLGKTVGKGRLNSIVFFSDVSGKLPPFSNGANEAAKVMVEQRCAELPHPLTARTHNETLAAPLFFLTETDVVPCPDKITPLVAVQLYDVAPVTAAMLTVPVAVAVFKLLRVNVPGSAGAPVTVMLYRLLLHPDGKRLARTLKVPLVKLFGKVTAMLLVVDEPVAPAGNVQV